MDGKDETLLSADEALLYGTARHRDAGMSAFVVEAMKAVCRIVAKTDGRAIGTGWLFYLNCPGHKQQTLLMTNNHVIADVKEAATMKAQFFYSVVHPSTAVEAKNVVEVEFDTKTFYTSPKLANNMDVPGAAHLDYTVIGFHMPKQEHKAKFDGIVPLCLSQQLPKPGDQYTIIQHPDGKPLCEGYDRVKAVGAFHVHYSVDTQGGSSGSPCLGPDGTVSALHHRAGLPSQGLVNQGVLIAKIYHDLIARLPTAVQLRLDPSSGELGLQVYVHGSQLRSMKWWIDGVPTKPLKVYDDNQALIQIPKHAAGGKVVIEAKNVAHTHNMEYKVVEIKDAPVITKISPYDGHDWVYITGQNFRLGSKVKLVAAGKTLRIPAKVYSATEIGFRLQHSKLGDAVISVSGYSASVKQKSGPSQFTFK